MSNDSRNNDSYPSLRLETSATSGSKRLITSLSAPIIIDVSDSSELERAYSDSLDRENSPDGSSLDALLSDNDVRSDCALNFAPSHVVVTEDSIFHVLASPKVEVTTLNKEKARHFIMTYWFTFGRDPSDVVIMDHLKLGTQSAMPIGSDHQMSFGVMRYPEEVPILLSRLMRENIVRRIIKYWEPSPV